MRLKYAIKRFLTLIPTFFGVTFFSFIIANMAPGDPLEMLIDPTGYTEEALEAMREAMGLNKGLFVRYFSWLGQLLQGNFGISYRTSRPVLEMILERLGSTLMITGTSLVISVIIAIILGVIAARKPYSAVDYLTSGLSFLATSTPNFFASLLMIYVFSVSLKWLPLSGMYTRISNPNFPDLVRHMIMPVAVLVLHQVGALIRQVRGSMLEVLQEDYIRTSREKGIKESVTVIRHGLRNALMPVVTQIGMSIPGLVSGAVVTERIFQWPGLGTLMTTSITYRDYPTIMGMTVFIAAVVLLTNFAVDLIYGLLDPRVRDRQALGGKK